MGGGASLLEASFFKDSLWGEEGPNGPRFVSPRVDLLAEVESFVDFVEKRGGALEVARRFVREMRAEGVELVREWAMHWAVKRELRRQFEEDKVRCGPKAYCRVVVIMDHKDSCLMNPRSSPIWSPPVGWVISLVFCRF